MRVARQILEHLLGSTKRALCVDDPVFSETLLQPSFEHVDVLEVSEASLKLEFTESERSTYLLKELPSKDRTQYSDRQEETWATSNPPLAIIR